MLAESDDTTAELLTKELGLHVSGQGTTAAGTKVIIDRLTADGLPVEGLVLNDGSGLDEGDRLTCDLLTEVLDRAGPDSELAKLLPVAGENGTLRPRMRRTPAQGQVSAKTGTLDHVNALAGFAAHRQRFAAHLRVRRSSATTSRGATCRSTSSPSPSSTAPAGPDIEQLAPKSG